MRRSWSAAWALFAASYGGGKILSVELDAAESREFLAALSAKGINAEHAMRAHLARREAVA